MSIEREYTGSMYKERKFVKKETPIKYLFLDVETTSKIISKKKKELDFLFCCVIYWNRKTNKKIEKIFYTEISFWKFVNSLFNTDNNVKEIQHLHLFAHNTQFDFKLLDGWRILPSLDWSEISFRAIKNTMFILELKKNNLRLHIWDTMNYVPQKLENIGESVGFPKLEIDFEKCSYQELITYCQRDTKIVFEFIKQYVEFLEQYGLTELRATASSNARNAFLIKFYHPNKDKRDTYLLIHSWQQIVKLEREAYRGGITDLFRYGEYNHEIVKLDVNSMYSESMRNKPLPIGLIGSDYESNRTQEELFRIYNYWKKKGYLFILTCSIYLPYKYSYIIKNFAEESNLNKNIFFYTKKGKSIEITLCTPELEFVEKYGKILKIHVLACYEPGFLFKEYVDFFFEMKVKFGKSGNKINRQICKLFLNCLYGKWGQKQIITKKFHKKTTNLRFFKKYFLEISVHLIQKMEKLNLKPEDIKTHLIYIVNYNGKEFWSNNGQIEYIVQTQENAKGSFVAICAFITSNARMLLIKYVLIAERKNVYYCDTDSLVVNVIGYNNLKQKGYIDKTEIGLLKIEKELNEREMSAFYNPKFYILGSERKCKGVRKDANIIEETDKYIKFEMEYWSRYKTDMKNGNYNKQIIVKKEKVASKNYDKGKIDDLGYVHPYCISEIKALI